MASRALRDWPGCSSIRCRATPAWTLIREMLWASDVVQLAGDAHALLAGPPLGLLGPGLLGGQAALAPGDGHLGHDEDEQQGAEVGGGRGRGGRLGPPDEGRQDEVDGKAERGRWSRRPAGPRP